MPAQKIIFDCDNTMGLPLKEVDDGLTLLYLLGQPDLEILGVTTIFGNGAIDEIYPQTCQLAKTLQLTIPVLKGAGRPDQDPNTAAASFLVEQVNQNPGEITLLATGAMSNLAAAAKLDPDFFSRVKSVAVMGGYTAPLKIGYRNLAELNFSADPQAALCVLSAPCPVTVMSGQVCLQAAITFRKINQTDWWPPNMKRILRRWLLAFGIFCGVNTFFLWDLLPAVYLTHPNIFANQTINLISTIKDLETGQLKSTTNALDDLPGHNINLPTGIKDLEQFYTVLENGWRHCVTSYPVNRI